MLPGTTKMAVDLIETRHDRIHRILEEEFHAAVKRRDAASAYFDEVRRSVPSGLPHPDGTQRITNASRGYSAALDGLTRAVLRVTHFEVTGVIPDDLKGQR